ncbi:MAG: hypothetical protein H0T43_09985 [Solirubrobacterales bacterium]|nr:hypothetical protein [Solirubrobacterales bacterium]
MRRIIVLSAAVIALGVTGSASAATTVVSPASLAPWQTYLNDAAGNPLSPGDGGVTFTQGPAAPPAGIGSARLATPSNAGDGSAQLRTTGYDGTPLSAFRALYYATFATASNGSQVPYLRLTLDLDGNGSADDAIVFEPVYQHGQTFAVPDQPAIQLGAWQLWDARRGGWWSQAGLAGATPGPGVKTLDQIIAAAPGARVIRELSGRGGLSLASGVAVAPARFDAAVDALTVDTGSGPTTFDFEPAPPPPVQGESVVLNEVSGDVRVRAPGGGAHRILRAGENLPVGTIVDARRGRAKLAVAVDRRGSTQGSDFFDGIFQVRQQRGSAPLTTLTVRTPGFARLCGVRAGGAQGSRAGAAQKRGRRSKKVAGRLWGDGRGRFRTKGRNSAATVRGTRWLTEERCDGTLTRVRRGVVDVRDERTGKTVRLRAGDSYLARRP